MAELIVESFSGLAMVSCANCSWWDELDDMTPEFVKEWHDVVVTDPSVPHVGPCPGFRRSPLWNVGCGFDYIINADHSETRWDGTLSHRWYGGGPSAPINFWAAGMDVRNRLAYDSDAVEQLITVGRFEETLPWYLETPWRHTIREICRDSRIQVNTSVIPVTLTRWRFVAVSSGRRAR